MAEAARAHTNGAGGRRTRDVIDDVVGPIAVSADPVYLLEVIEAEIVAHAPRDHVIGARRVTADTHAADDLGGTAGFDVKTKPATEYVHAADPLADHRVGRLAIVGGVGRGAVRRRGVDGVAVLQAVEAAAERLHRGVEVRGREREPVQAEGIRRIRLLRRDHAAAWPLCA